MALNLPLLLKIFPRGQNILHSPHLEDWISVIVFMIYLDALRNVLYNNNNNKNKNKSYKNIQEQVFA